MQLDPQDDQFDALLVAYDQALAGGEASSAELMPLEGELASRLDNAKTALELLAKVRQQRQQTDSKSQIANRQLQTEDATPAFTTPGPPTPPLTTHPCAIGRFVIERELGRGGHGVVFLARDPRLARRVALKVPRPEALLDEPRRRRFLLESRAAAALSHQNLVTIHEMGDDGLTCYIASAYCEGPTLGDWLRDLPHPPSPTQAAEIVAALADGVEHAHRQGVLHRDIKPGNILLFPTADPAAQALAFVPKLTDFGLAKLTEQTRGETRTGDRLGTLAYMAPEQAEGRLSDIGPPTDVYALGAVLYELLVGRPPYLGENEADTLRLVLAGDLPSPRALPPGLPRDLEAVVLTCLEAKPQRRYASAAALAADLRRFVAGEATFARPWGPARQLRRVLRKHPTSAVALLALVGLACGGWWSSARLSEAVATVTDERDKGRRALERARAEQRKSDRLAYAHSVRLGWDAWKSGRAEQAREWLDAARPNDDREDLREFAWRHLWVLTHQEALTLAGHDDEVFCVAFSPDGTKVASGGKDHTVRIWDAATGEALCVLRGHNDEVNGVAFSPDGAKLASASEEGRLCVWDASSGRLLHQTDREGQTDRAGQADREGTALFGIAFSPEGELMAAGEQSGRVRLWNTADWRELAPLVGHEDRAGCVAFSADGRTLASGSEDWTLRLWDVESRQEKARLRPHDSTVSGVAFSRDGTMLAHSSKGRRQLVAVRPLSPQGELGEGVDLPPYTSWVESVAFCANDRLLAVACKNGTIELLDTKTWRVQRRLNSHVGRVWGLAVSADDRRLASAGADRTVKLWDVGESPPHLTLETPHVDDLAFSADGKLLALGGTEIRLIDAATGELKLAIGLEYEISADVDGDGRSDSVHFHDGEWQITLADGSAQRRSFGRSGDVPIVWDCDADGRADLGVYRDQAWQFECQDGLVRTVNATSGVDSPPPSAARLYHLHSQTNARLTEAVRAIALSPRGDLAATRHGDRRVKLWDLRTGERAGIVETETAATAAGFSPNGAILATGDDHGRVVLWNMAERRRGLTWNVTAEPAANHDVFAVCFSPDGRTLATTCRSRKGCVDLWATAGGTLAGSLVDTDSRDANSRDANSRDANSRDDCHDLAFSPDGRWLAATGFHKAVVWDIAARQVKLTLALASAGRAVSFSASGRTIATDNGEGAVGLWDLRTAQRLVTFGTLARDISAVRFSPRGRRLAAAGSLDGNRSEVHIFSGLETLQNADALPQDRVGR